MRVSSCGDKLYRRMTVRRSFPVDAPCGFGWHEGKQNIMYDRRPIVDENSSGLMKSIVDRQCSNSGAPQLQTVRGMNRSKSRTQMPTIGCRNVHRYFHTSWAVDISRHRMERLHKVLNGDLLRLSAVNGCRTDLCFDSLTSPQTWRLWRLCLEE